MKETTNYKLKQQELTDKADITQISDNWTIIDTELQRQKETDQDLSNNKFDKAGGTITGEVTLKGELNAESPVRSTKAEFLQMQMPSIAKGTAPDAQTWSYMSWFDKGGWGAENRLAHIDYSVQSDGTVSLDLLVNQYVEGSEEKSPVGIWIRQVTGTDPQIGLTHFPPDDSNDYSIPTTSWVRKTITAETSKTQLVRW